MKTSTINFVGTTMLFNLCLLCSANAQEAYEIAQKLSEEAQKGFVDDVRFESDGSVHVIYQNRIGKKSDEIVYEEYVFDRDLKFIANNKTSVAKETREDKEVKRLGAYVGGCTSFDILSMKIRVVRNKLQLSDWNYRKQRYERRKVIDSEVVKLKSEEGKAYMGIAEFYNEADDKIVLLAFNETKDKNNPRKYVMLSVDYDGGVSETPIDAPGKYSIVYTQEINADNASTEIGKQDIIIVMAPAAGTGSPRDYIYLHYDINGKLKNKVLFNSPSPNMLVANAKIVGNSVYMFGQSTDSKDAYDKVFDEYMPISNPCYPASFGGGNPKMDKYYKASDGDMDFFHVLKVSGGKLDFATTTPISGMKSKVKTPPSQKAVTPYTGRKFSIHQFVVTKGGEFLVAGQLLGRTNIGNLKNPVFTSTYKDIICLHFDSQGNVKAQYAVDKMWEDERSRVFEMPQNFYLSADGKSVFWEIYEVKGVPDKSFWASYNRWYGVDSYFPRYYPRVAKIDLEKTTIGDFKVMGDRKHYMFANVPGMFVPGDNSITYVGKNNDESDLWVGKVRLE